MLRILLLLILSVPTARADDNSAFFGLFSETPWVMVSPCQGNKEVDALIFSHSMLESEFVVMVAGHVVQMAHIKSSGDDFVVVDANGGIASYKQVRESVGHLIHLPFVRTKGATLEKYLATETWNAPKCQRGAAE